MIKTSYLLKNAIGRLVLPPGLCLLLLACAVLMWRRYPRFARYLCGINVLILLLLSLPAVSIALRQTIEPPPLNPQALAQADAIVGLGGGTRFGALETSDGRDVSEVTLQRVRYTASLARRSGLPVAFTGGAAFGEKMSEAELMARSYHDDFGMQARWVENTAFDTGDNARFTAQKLLPRYRRIILVSSAWHLPRAVPLFERAGFIVTPAPTGYISTPPASALLWVPDVDALSNAFWTLHEGLGIVWYRWGPGGR
ncbi:YdcF family protein [Silvimonas sp. JCM 19000]